MWIVIVARWMRESAVLRGARRTQAAQLITSPAASPAASPTASPAAAAVSHRAVPAAFHGGSLFHAFGRHRARQQRSCAETRSALRLQRRGCLLTVSRACGAPSRRPCGRRGEVATALTGTLPVNFPPSEMAPRAASSCAGGHGTLQQQQQLRERFQTPL